MVSFMKRTALSGFLTIGLVAFGIYKDITPLITSLPDGWYASRPVKLNDNGQIVCYGQGPDPENAELWLLTPHAVPEPASMLALAVPALMLLVRRRRTLRL